MSASHPAGRATGYGWTTHRRAIVMSFAVSLLVFIPLLVGGMLVDRPTARWTGSMAGPVTVSPDGRWLAVGVGTPGDYATIEVRELPAGTLAHRFTGQQVASLAFTPDSRLLAAGGMDPATWLWSLETGTVVRKL